MPTTTVIEMEELVRQLSTSDTKKKLLVGQQLIEFLGDPESVVECDEMGACVDSLVPWMQSSNFKVRALSLYAIVALSNEFRFGGPSVYNDTG